MWSELSFFLSRVSFALFQKYKNAFAEPYSAVFLGDESPHSQHDSKCEFLPWPNFIEETMTIHRKEPVKLGIPFMDLFS